MEKSHHAIRIDEEINSFYPEISENIEIIPYIPQEKALLIFNDLLSYVCDTSNFMLIDYASELINKIPAEWFRNNIRKAVELKTGNRWIFDMDDPYVYNNLKKSLLNGIAQTRFLNKQKIPSCYRRYFYIQSEIYYCYDCYIISTVIFKCLTYKQAETFMKTYRHFKYLFHFKR